jgi:hypothetical protein
VRQVPAIVLGIILITSVGAQGNFAFAIDIQPEDEDLKSKKPVTKQESPKSKPKHPDKYASDRLKVLRCWMKYQN